MSVPSIFTHQDVVSEIIKFLPSFASLATTCKTMLQVTGAVGVFNLGREMTKQYLEDVEFRERVNGRMQDPSRQLGLDCLCLKSLFEELYCVWRPEYADVLAGMKTLRLAVPLEVVPELPMKRFGNLERLDIDSKSGLCRVSILGDLVNLKSLGLTCDEVDLSGLKKLQNLNILRIVVEKGLRNEIAIADLTQLKKLHLEAEEINLDFMSHPNLQNLTELTIACDVEQDYEFLRTFRNLVSINIKGMSPDLTVLVECKNLQYLSLEECEAEDLSPLTKLPKLQTLNLFASAASEFSPLAAISSLKDLCVDDTAFSDLAVLTKLQKLQSLGLSETQVADITVLPEFSSLESVHLISCRIKCYGPLFKFPNLKFISADC